MTPDSKTTKVMLLAVAVTGLVFAGLTPTTAHNGAEDVDDHALSRTFPDLTAGVRTVVCSEEVATLLGFGAPKDPTEPECNEDNPNWLTALNTGGATSSGFYYDLLRVRALLREECPDIGGIDDNLIKAGNRCETDISQNALFALGNPNDWYPSAKPGDVTWELGLCPDGAQNFINAAPGDQTGGLMDEADAISCEAPWSSSGDLLDATDVIVDFGPNSVGTGFFRPTIEEVWEQAGDPSGNHYLGSCLYVSRAHEVMIGAASVQHTEFRVGGNSYMDSHDWFYVVDENIGGAADSVLYNLAGSDTQADDRQSCTGGGEGFHVEPTSVPDTDCASGDRLDITVEDEGGDPVSAATVKITWFQNMGRSEFDKDTGSTDSNGEMSICIPDASPEIDKAEVLAYDGNGSGTGTWRR